MKDTLRSAVLIILSYGSVALGQTANSDRRPSISQVEGGLVQIVESVIVPAAEAMPEDKYSFAPSAGQFKGVRTFAQQVKHLAAANYEMGSAILEEEPPAEVGENGPASVEGKAETVKYLRNSFAYLQKAFISINENNATEEIVSPIQPGKVTKLGLATLCLWHDFDHYGQMAEYLRMNGIIPPASPH
jgi:uncharacterized damage-inducible protein DinB